MTNKNLATKNTTDFTVLDSGEAYISQRKAAELLGVNPKTLMSHILRRHPNTNTSKGLDAKTLQSAGTYFAYKSRTKSVVAEALCDKLMEAGAKAYIYHEAGYAFSATPKQPQTRVELARALLNQELALERSEDEKAKIIQEFIDSKNIDGLRDFKSTADVINKSGWGRNTMLKLLRDRKWFTKGNKPYRDHIENGRFEVHTHRQEYDNGDVYSRDVVFITNKGVVDIQLLIVDHESVAALPLPPAPPSVLRMISEPKDVTLWRNNGWSDALLVEHGHAEL